MIKPADKIFVTYRKTDGKVYCEVSTKNGILEKRNEDFPDYGVQCYINIDLINKALNAADILKKEVNNLLTGDDTAYCDAIDELNSIRMKINSNEQ